MVLNVKKEAFPKERRKPPHPIQSQVKAVETQEGSAWKVFIVPQKKIYTSPTHLQDSVTPEAPQVPPQEHPQEKQAWPLCHHQVPTDQ